MHTYSSTRVLQQRMRTVYERMHITTRLELLYAYYDVGEE